MTTAQYANLQRRFNRAHARTKRIVDKYCEYVNGKAFCLIPGLVAIEIGECTCDRHFFTVKASSPCTHEKLPVYVKARGKCYHGYEGWRSISDAELRKINKMELAILDAWDAENDLYFELKQ